MLMMSLNKVNIYNFIKYFLAGLVNITNGGPTIIGTEEDENK